MLSFEIAWAAWSTQEVFCSGSEIFMSFASEISAAESLVSIIVATKETLFGYQ